MKIKTILLCIVLIGVNTLIQAQELAAVKEKKLFGYINTQGMYEIEPQFKDAKSFSEGVALVLSKENKKWGYIDKSGKWIIKPQFDGGKAFKSGIGFVRIKRDWFYINIKGEKLTMPEGVKRYPFSKDGVALIRTEKGVGVIDTNGKFVVEPKYGIIRSFKNGYARVKTFDDKWGVIDNTGTIIVEVKYKEVGNFYNGVARVITQDGDFGLVNAKNEFMYLKDVSKLWDFREINGIAPAVVKGKVGFINNKGEWVITPQYKKGRASLNGYAGVYKRGWGLIDVKGNLIIDHKYFDIAYVSNEGLLPYRNSNNELWGFVNLEGKEITKAIYVVSRADLGFHVNANNGFSSKLTRINSPYKDWGFLKTDGSILNDKWYKYAHKFVNVE